LPIDVLSTAVEKESDSDLSLSKSIRYFSHLVTMSGVGLSKAEAILLTGKAETLMVRLMTKLPTDRGNGFNFLCKEGASSSSFLRLSIDKVFFLRKINLLLFIIVNRIVQFFRNGVKAIFDYLF
jgi:hypothetical protein